MYESKIAIELKKKIDGEIIKFKSNNSLFTPEEQIENIQTKEELIKMRNELLFPAKEETMVERNTNYVKEKKYTPLDKTGFINILVLCLFIVLSIGIGIGIGFIIHSII